MQKPDACEFIRDKKTKDPHRLHPYPNITGFDLSSPLILKYKT